MLLILAAGPDATNNILIHDQLWIFTPDLWYSTSSKSTQRAMKIFYTTVTEPTRILERQSNKTEEFQLPSFALENLHTDLQASTNILPPSARTFQTWTIGLLDR